jgi:HEAT repeat protein
MTQRLKYLIYSISCSAIVSLGLADEPQVTPPDLTLNPTVNREMTYNLGPTGLRGWIHTKAATNLDSEQGRTTLLSRQILVTHVGAKSPADGIINVNDIILGVGGKPFTDDARKSIAKAIQEAEKTDSQGNLTLTVWRSGTTTDLVLKLRVLGTYATTAPFNCAKSAVIFEDACKALEAEPLEQGWRGAVIGLALLATGDPKHLPKLKKFAHQLGPETLQLELKDGPVVWDWGYTNIFLCEYYLQTGDRLVAHAIKQYTISLAKGQGLYGTFGHGISSRTKDGQLHGSIPPYGPVNAAGLVANIAIVMGKKCGVKDPEIDPAIDRASKFFGYFVNKGAIPYGEHMPWASHENNGKNAMAAMLFALQGNKVKETQFFAKMVTASHQNREYGHTGQGFSYLWGALGANTGGPMATAAYFKEASWHFDLVRRCDGSFTYDGAEQYGGGKTNDNTYYGKSGYNGLSPTASYVLTYSLPHQKLYLTGKKATLENSLSKNDVAEAINSGYFAMTRKTLTPKQLLEAFGDWSPVVRSWAAEEFGKRPESKTLAPTLLTMAEGPDARKRQAAAEALGYMNNPTAPRVLARLLTHEDRWLRVKAANALRNLNDKAKSVVPEMLKAVADTAQPIYPVAWADPIQLTHGELAAALFKGLLRDSIEKIDTKLLFPAIRAVMKNPDGMARATLNDTFENKLTEENVKQLAPDLLEAILIPCPADTMYSAEIRMSALIAMSKYHYKEAIAAGVVFAKTQGGNGSETRTKKIVDIIAGYGIAARGAIPSLKQLIVVLDEQTARVEFPADLNKVRTRDVQNAIDKIEAATTQPLLKTITNNQR